jgi:hypothetical protein
MDDMTDGPAPIPGDNQGVIAAKALKLEGYLGQSVVDFCGKYGSIGDSENHCAHFVSHVLGLRIPGAALCSNVAGSAYAYEDRRKGFCIRVNQVFNSCSNRVRWSDAAAPATVCFIVATLEANIESESPLTIGSMRKKHIGFYSDGWVYNYGNTADKVRKTSLGDFKRHYGAHTILLKADLP